MKRSRANHWLCLAILLWGGLSSCFSGCASLRVRAPWTPKSTYSSRDAGVGLGQSISQLQNQLERVENAPELNVELGKLFLQSGQLLPAARQVQLALDQNCRLTEAWILGGDIEAAKSNPSEALANYQHALNLGGDQVKLLQRVARCYLKMERPFRAAASVENLMGHYEFEQPPLDVLILYGSVMQEVGQYAQASLAFSRACDDPQSSEDCFVRLSKAQWLAGEPDASHRTLLAGLERFPESTTIRHQMEAVLASSDEIVSR